MTEKFKEFLELTQKDTVLEARLLKCEAMQDIALIAEEYGVSYEDLKTALKELDSSDADAFLEELE